VWLCRARAYVLTNHVPLLVTSEDTEGPSRLMQAVGRRYVGYVNKTYRRTGTLRAGRFKSGLIDSDAYLLTRSRYIELNPVRVGMVQHPHEHRWPSYRYNACSVTYTVLSEHQLYRSLGTSPEERQEAHRGLFAGDLGDVVLRPIRSGTEEGEVIGNDRFRAQIEPALRRWVIRLPHGGDRKSQAFRQQRKLNIYGALP